MFESGHAETSKNTGQERVERFEFPGVFQAECTGTKSLIPSPSGGRRHEGEKGFGRRKERKKEQKGNQPSLRAAQIKGVNIGEF